MTMEFRGKTIVTIDDTESIRSFIKIMLEAKGADVLEAANANDGLALCQQHEPDIVILDLGLPDRDGLDVLPDIRKTLSNHASNVIILTVRKEHKYRDKAKERGADAFLSKPFQINELIDTIHRVSGS